MTRSKLEAKRFIEPPTEAGTDLTHVYTLIHSFLKERSHSKAASALKKAVTGIITIDDGAKYKGPTLQKILEEWRELKAAADAIDTSSSDSSSDSSDDDSQVENNKYTSKSEPSDSSDDSSDDSDDSPQEAMSQVAKLLESQRDSSKTLSSADDVESDEESTDETGSDSSDESEADVDTDPSSVPTSKKSGSKRKVSRAKKPATSSPDVSSSSSSDSDSDEEDELPSVSKQKTKSTSSSDSSSSSDSDSDQDSKPATTNKLKRKAASSSDSDSSSEDDTSEGSSSGSSSETSSSQSEDELEETSARSVKPVSEARAMKKRRANEEGKSIVVATTATVTTLADNTCGGKASRKPNAPFQRVKVEAVKLCDERLKDNSFESRGAREDDYGTRANRDLIVTRGDGFRKEKNKKKRGSYRGGDITLQSHSFKFED